MKKTNAAFSGIRPILVWGLWTMASLAQGQGIPFYGGPWADALTKAREEDKLVFVDMYTAWCVPCKEMERTVFVDAGVGALFGESFVSVRLDAEKGEGVALQETYRVEAFPTFLFVSPDGRLIHKAVGKKDAKTFIGIAREALQRREADQPLEVYAAAYASGNRDPDLVRAYLRSGALHASDLSEALNAYVSSLTEAELQDKATLELIAQSIHWCEGPAYQALVKIKSETKSLFSIPMEAHAAVRQGIAKAQRNTLKKAIETRNPALLDSILVAERSGSAAFAQLRKENEITYFLQTGNLERYWPLIEPEARRLMAMSKEQLARMDTASHRMMLLGLKATEKDTASALYQEVLRHPQPRTSSAAGELAEYALGIAKLTTDTAYLEQALRWSARALELYPESLTYGAHGRMLLALGLREQAIWHLEEAIRRAEYPAEAERWRRVK